MEKQFLQQVCDALNLGTLTAEPQRLSGGFLHNMVSLFTEKGKYAVKLLNPHIMARESAMGNFRTAEQLESVLEAAALPILPALSFHGKKMQEIGGQYFYVFDWFDGKALRPEEITAAHAAKIGKILARIHSLEQKDSADSPDILNIDWTDYVRRLETANPELHVLLKAQLLLLHSMQAAANSAAQRLPTVSAICHNDMDPKNVLWNGETCRVIDLECLTYGNPYSELCETALCWSGLDACRIDPKLFCALVCAYRDAGGTLPADWAALYDANCGRLLWLEYNLKRALGMECSQEEISVGASAARMALAQLCCMAEARESLLQALRSIYAGNCLDSSEEPQTFVPIK